MTRTDHATVFSTLRTLINHVVPCKSAEIIPYYEQRSSYTKYIEKMSYGASGSCSNWSVTEFLQDKPRCCRTVQ